MKPLKLPTVKCLRRQVIQLIPRLPPAICGVGDHAMAIGKEFSRSHQIDVTYVGINRSEDTVESPELRSLPARSAAELVIALRHAELNENSRILLHFSGYSLGKRGICFWLIAALKEFLAERPDIQLTTMFHELWSPAPLLSRSGWIVPFQKSVVKKLVAISHVVRTNRVEYQRRLEELFPACKGQVGVNNICSNFGEPSNLAPIGRRKRQILIFQPPDLSTQAGTVFWNGWRQLREQLGDVPTIIAGRTRAVPDDDSIDARGFVTVEEGSRLMGDSQIAYFEYFDGYLGKSSLFGSLAAHGIVPVMPCVNRSEAEGILHDVHYLTPDDEKLKNTAALETVSGELQRWYATHSIEATARDYHQAMSSFIGRRCA